MVDKVKRANRDMPVRLRGFDADAGRAVSKLGRDYGFIRLERGRDYPTERPRTDIKIRSKPIISSSTFDNIVMVASRIGGLLGGIALGSFVESVSENLGFMFIGVMAGFFAAGYSLERLGRIYYNRLKRIESLNERESESRARDGKRSS